MKTAREIIAAATYESWANYPACTHSLPWEQEAEKLPGKAASFRKHADAILAALAAEGFSIVETGRDPVTIEAIRAILDDDDADVYEKLGDIRAAFSRSTREGKP